MRHRTFTAALIVLLILAIAPTPAASSVEPETSPLTILSRSAGGQEGNGRSRSPRISADGRFVVFVSEATNLVPGDTNGQRDVFVAAVDGSPIERVSVASDEQQADGRTEIQPSISADGRFVAFDSKATNLAPPCAAPDTWRVYVRDRALGTTECVSVASGGAPANADSGFTAISADGRYVAFISEATNLGADSQGVGQAYVRDRALGVTELVSHSADGDPLDGGPEGGARWAAISADGRYVAFEANASNLDYNASDGRFHAYVHDRQADVTEWVSRPYPPGVGENGDSIFEQLSADGRYVLFISTSSNLVPGDTNQRSDWFLHDRQTGVTELASLRADGSQIHGNMGFAGVSPDGRFVGFSTDEDGLVPLDTNGDDDVFARDRVTGALECLSCDDSGDPLGRAYSYSVSFSADNRFVVFDSGANGKEQIYVRDRATVRFAAPAARGNGDCTSWADACSLMDALNCARPGDEIWAEAGVYTPAPPGGERAAAFRLPGGVSLYGGFAGGEASRDSRDPAAHPTLLSGDLNGDDDGFTNNAENCFHVVIADGDNILLDGVAISGGNANGTGLESEGGGVYLRGRSLRLNRVVLRGNSAMDGGGLAAGDESLATINQATFQANRAGRNGGGMMVYAESRAALTAASFDANTAGENGGGLFADAAPGLDLAGVTFHANTAGEDGGGMYVSNDTAPTLAEVLFDANTAGEDGGGLYAERDCNPTLAQVRFHANAAGQDGGGMAAAGGRGKAPLTLTGVTFDANTAEGEGGGLLIVSSEPELTNVTFYANNLTRRSGKGSAMIFSGAHAALRHVTMVENTVDGVNKYQLWVEGQAALVNSIVWGGSYPIIVPSGLLTVSDSIVAGGWPGEGVLGSDPRLAPFGDYGGGLPTLALLPGSPAIDAAPAGCASHDARRRQRHAGACDLGAFESSGFALSLASGDGQSAPCGAPFALPLRVRVAAADAAEPVDGGCVAFTAPTAGPSAVLDGGPGVACATITGGYAAVFAAGNGLAGGPYEVTAQAGGAPGGVRFRLWNLWMTYLWVVFR